MTDFCLLGSSFFVLSSMKFSYKIKMMHSFAVFRCLSLWLLWTGILTSFYSDEYVRYFVRTRGLNCVRIFWYSECQWVFEVHQYWWTSRIFCSWKSVTEITVIEGYKSRIREPAYLLVETKKAFLSAISHKERVSYTKRLSLSILNTVCSHSIQNNTIDNRMPNGCLSHSLYSVAGLPDVFQEN